MLFKFIVVSGFGLNISSQRDITAKDALQKIKPKQVESPAAMIPNAVKNSNKKGNLACSIKLEKSISRRAAVNDQ